MVRASG
jgi:hypothetical protein